MKIGVTGFEPATSWSRTNEQPALTIHSNEDTPTPSDACTIACTNNPETAKATDLDALAAELMKLPKEDRARLLAKLLGNGAGE